MAADNAETLRDFRLTLCWWLKRWWESSISEDFRGAEPQWDSTRLNAYIHFLRRKWYALESAGDIITHRIRWKSQPTNERQKEIHNTTRFSQALNLEHIFLFSSHCVSAVCPLFCFCIGRFCCDIFNVNIFSAWTKNKIQIHRERHFLKYWCASRARSYTFFLLFVSSVFVALCAHFSPNTCHNNNNIPYSVVCHFVGGLCSTADAVQRVCVHSI